MIDKEIFKINNKVFEQDDELLDENNQPIIVEINETENLDERYNVENF